MNLAVRVVQTMVIISFFNNQTLLFQVNCLNLYIAAIQEELELMKKQIEQNEKEEEEMKKSYEEKLAAALANKTVKGK